MAGDSFHYEKDGEDFVLVHETYDLDGGREEFYRGKDVAIGFTFDPNTDRGIQFTTHRHGSPETVEEWSKKTRVAFQGLAVNTPLQKSLMPHTIATDQWDVEDLNRIINTTGYLGVVLNKLGISVAG